jgi:hypothetical protein
MQSPGATAAGGAAGAAAGARAGGYQAFLERMNGAAELRELVRLRLGLLLRREGRLDSRTVLGGVRELEARLREHGLWRAAGPDELAALGENVEKLVTLRLHARLFQAGVRGGGVKAEDGVRCKGRNGKEGCKG